MAELSRLRWLLLSAFETALGWATALAWRAIYLVRPFDDFDDDRRWFWQPRTRRRIYVPPADEVICCGGDDCCCRWPAAGVDGGQG